MLPRLAALLSALTIACVRPTPATTSSSTPTSTPTDTFAPQISRVEQGLLPAVQVAGEVVEVALADRMRELGIPGLGIAVFADHRLLWARGYGVADVDTGARVDTGTLFQAASISKSVNALAVLLVAADGELALDRPINEMLVGWKLPDNDLTRASPVTLRRLLGHNAGTTVHGFPGYAPGERVPTLLQILAGEPPANTGPVVVDLAPGTKFRYSGGGTTITQLALTERTRQDYASLLASRVLGPLGMTSSTHAQPLPPERLRRAAAGHGADGRTIAGKRHTYPEQAAAGLWTTPSDLARFFAEVALARAGRSKLVPRAVAEAMTTKLVGIEGSDDAVGLGVFLSARNGARFFGHGGSNEGFMCDAIASLDGGYGVVLMTNSDSGWRIFGEVERTVFAAHGWAGADVPIVRVALAPADRARFVGRYLDGAVPRELAAVGERLVSRELFGPDVELVPVAPELLVVRATGERIARDAGGALTIAGERAPKRPLTRLADDARHPLLVLAAGDFAGAEALWREQARADKARARADEPPILEFGYRLIDREPKRALELLRLVAAVFPDSSDAHHTLAMACERVGDAAGALAGYERALATLDADPRITAGKTERRAHAEAQRVKLRAATPR